MSAIAGVDFAIAGRMALADARERVRRYSFFVTVAATIWFCSICLPPIGARYSTIRFGEWRGVYNSAWVGGAFALLANLLLSLPGFYLVKNTLQRDRDTGVGALLMATPVSRMTYLTAKTLSNLVYLGLTTAVLAGGALVLQLARGESRAINVWQLWSPMALVVLPAMAMIAACAVLFEVIPAFRGALGNAVFFGLWVAFIGVTSGLPRGGSTATSALTDLFGAGVVTRSMAAALAPQFPGGNPIEDVQVGLNIQASSGPTQSVRTFVWNGLTWTPFAIAGRLFWFAAALAVTALAARLFNRFDEERGRAVARKSAAPVDAAAPDAAAESPGVAPRSAAAPTTLTPLGPFPGVPRLGGIVAAELRLAFKGVGRWWAFVAGGLAIAGALVPAGAPRGILLALAWMWPLPIFSSMGCRARRYGVDVILAAAPRPRLAQRLGLYAAGVLVATFTGGGVLLRLLVTGDTRGIAAFACGALFVPAMALCLGLLSGAPRLFEALYLALWYAGPMNQVPPLDYGGFTPAGLAQGAPFIFLAIAAAGLVMAFLLAPRPAAA
jgi:hypothetical protein